MKKLTITELRARMAKAKVTASVVAPTATPVATPVVPKMLPEEVLGNCENHEVGLIHNVLSSAAFRESGYAAYDESLTGTCLLVTLGAINCPGEPLEEWVVSNASYIKVGGEGLKFTGEVLVNLEKAGYLDCDFIPTVKMSDLLTEHESTNFSITPVAPVVDGECYAMKTSLEHLSSCEISHAIEYAKGVKQYLKGGYSKAADTRGVMTEKIRQTERLINNALAFGEQLLFQAWKHDDGGRLYPTVWQGGNTQGGDLAKAMLTYPKDANTPDFDTAILRGMILAELEGCTALRDEELEELVLEVSEMTVPEYLTSQINGRPDGIKDKCGVEGTIEGVVKPKKVHMFYAWAQDYAALLQHIYGDEEKPVLKAMIGPDAKASGVQLAAFIANCWRILQHCGFVVGVNDVYEEYANRLRKEGIADLTRSEAKEVVVAGIYGQQAQGLMKAGYEPKQAYAMTRELHKFLGPIATIMANMADAVHHGEESFVKDHITFSMPDGFEVCKKRYQRFDWYGQPVGGVENEEEYTEEYKGKNYKLLLKFGVKQLPLDGFNICSDELDTKRMASTAFVTLIHAVDAMMLRAILVLMSQEDIPVWCFPAHDCLYVMPKDIERTRELIDTVYASMFGFDDPNAVPELFPMGTDFLQLFYQGVARSRIDGKQPLNGKKSQFYTHNGEISRSFKGIPVLDAAGGYTKGVDGKRAYSDMMDLIATEGLEYFH